MYIFLVSIHMKGWTFLMTWCTTATRRVIDMVTNIHISGKC